MRILLSKSREKKWNALFKKKTKNFKLDSKRNYTKILRFFFYNLTGVRIGNETDSRTRNKWPFHQINHPKEISLQRERERGERNSFHDRSSTTSSQKRKFKKATNIESTLSPIDDVSPMFRTKKRPATILLFVPSEIRGEFFRSERIFMRLEKFVERGKRVEETFRGDERKPQSDIFPLGTAACPRLDCLEGICYGHLLPTKRREGTRVPRGPLFATTKHI